MTDVEKCQLGLEKLAPAFASERLKGWSLGVKISFKLLDKFGQDTSMTSRHMLFLLQVPGMFAQSKQVSSPILTIY